jgi:anti-sigma B factor antagonist
MDFTLQIHGRIGGEPAITVRGDLGYGTCRQFLDCLDRFLQPTPTAVHVDLHLVPFIDSSGLGALVSAHKRTRRIGARLVLERPTPAVHRTIHTAGLANLFGLDRS